MAGKKKAKKKGRLRVHRVVDVPLREVSGICLRRGRGQMTLVAIGDRVAMVAWATLQHGHKGSIDWRTIDVARLSGSQLPVDDPQIEAVCADGAGRLLLLQEAPPRAELVDLAARRVAASIELVLEGRDELARSWSNPKGSRGEGAVLLPGGHLLVAKEKSPAALIEFGPPGSRSRGLIQGGALAAGARWPVGTGTYSYVARAVWRPDKALTKACADFSDLEIGPDGRLYLLSDKSAVIARIDDLPAGGGTARLSAAWCLEDLEGKPEGLAFTPTGHAIIALDTRKAGNNLVLVKPAIATARDHTARARAR